MTVANRLELRAVTKTYGDLVAVNQVSMELPAGTVVGLLGPNGAGKTTTIRMIMDIIAPDSGEILLFDQPRRRQDLDRIGYLPEERGLYRKLTVLEHLVFMAELHGLRRRAAQPRAASWLERFELAEWGKKKVEELSKGMQQKIQLAGTLLHDPQIIILDEPFAGLDPINQGLFKEILGELKAEGKAILFSTHVMEQAEKLCDSICLISQGRVMLSGELAAIKREMGGNAFRLVASGDLERLEELPEIEAVIPSDGSLRLLLADGVDGSEVLRRLVEFLEVAEFYSEEPELEEIFIKAVRDAG
jgi:ABC-2 type transport system ATP-binding protein